MSPRFTRREWFWLASPALLVAQGLEREEDLKAALILSFARFTEWPPKAGAFAFGLLANPVLERSLQRICAGRQIQGRQIEVRPISSPADVRDCDLIFVGALDSRRLDVFISPIADKPVLTIGEANSFHSRGGIVQLFQEDGRLNFTVHLENLASSGLTISSKLLRLGYTIGRSGERRRP